MAAVQAASWPLFPCSRCNANYLPQGGCSIYTHNNQLQTPEAAQLLQEALVDTYTQTATAMKLHPQASLIVLITAAL